MSSSQRQRLVETIEGMRDELVQMTSDLIRFRTDRLTGTDFKASVDYMTARLQKAGLSVDVYEVPREEMREAEDHGSNYRGLGLSGPIAPRYNAIALKKGSGGGKSLHLNGHYCIVAPTGRWSADPFEPRVADGRLIGRGACDMKSGLAMIVGALNALQREAVRLRGDVIVSVTVDTHFGGDLGAGYVAKHGLGRADMVIMADTSGVDRVLRGYRGQLWVEIEVRGQTAHGSTPFYGRSAIEDMGRVIARLLVLRDHLATVTSRTRITPQEAMHPTIVLTQISGGTGLNLVAPSCRLTLDRRLIPEETPQEALDHIRQAVAEAQAEAPGLDATVREIYKAPATVTSDSDPLVTSLLCNIEATTSHPGEAIVHPAFLDLRWFTQAWGVPGVVYGPGDGGAKSGFRTKVYSQPDEYVVIDDLVNATKVLALTIVDLVEAMD